MPTQCTIKQGEQSEKQAFDLPLCTIQSHVHQMCTEIQTSTIPQYVYLPEKKRRYTLLAEIHAN